MLFIFAGLTPHAGDEFFSPFLGVLAPNLLASPTRLSSSIHYE